MAGCYAPVAPGAWSTGSIPADMTTRVPFDT